MTSEKILTLKDLTADVHATAKAAGWHDVPRTLVEDLCLIHTEVSEVVEEVRNGQLPGETYYEKKPDGTKKPCGIPSELADIIIRTLHVAAKFGVDIEAALKEKMSYNKTRPYRHGGKKL